jgi:hypothetical protein
LALEADHFAVRESVVWHISDSMQCPLSRLSHPPMSYSMRRGMRRRGLSFLRARPGRPTCDFLILDHASAHAGFTEHRGRQLWHGAPRRGPQRAPFRRQLQLPGHHRRCKAVLSNSFRADLCNLPSRPAARAAVLCRRASSRRAFRRPPSTARAGQIGCTRSSTTAIA